MDSADNYRRSSGDHVKPRVVRRRQIRGQHLGHDLEDDVVSAQGHETAPGAASGQQQPARPEQGHSPRATRPLGLTQNQFDLLRLYAHGLTVKEIAARQSRGMSTIYQSLQRIKARLNIERDADLIAFAIEHGLRSSTPSSPSTRCGTR